VNKGNCLFVAHEYHRAKELYLEAIGVQADCVEAIYNLGLANVRMNSPDEARQAFEKLHTIIPNNPAVIYQIANLYEQQNQNQQAAKWFNVLIARVPTDPGILSRLGQIYSKENEESQGFHYQLESYRHYPVNLDVISWLGVWFVKHEMYEKSIHYFERASQIQPNEVKWRLMVTSCYRRMGNYSKALQLYEQIHEEVRGHYTLLLLLATSY
jgi:intraflagellar transport protein 88